MVSAGVSGATVATGGGGVDSSPKYLATAPIWAAVRSNFATAPPGAGADSAGAATVGRGTEGRRGPSSPRRAPSRYARRMDPTRPRARSTGVAVGRGGRAAAVARGASSRPDPDGASHHVREARWIRRPRRSARRNCAVLPRSYADRASGVGRGAGGRRRSRANCFRRRAPATLDASDVLRGVAPESPAARDSRRRSRGGMSLSRTPVVASARPVLGRSLGPRAPGRERPRRRAAPRGERRREGVLEVGETKRLCGVCRCVSRRSKHPSTGRGCREERSPRRRERRPGVATSARAGAA